jgi:hypothetical protein
LLAARRCWTRHDDVGIGRLQAGVGRTASIACPPLFVSISPSCSLSSSLTCLALDCWTRTDQAIRQTLDPAQARSLGREIPGQSWTLRPPPRRRPRSPSTSRRRLQRRNALTMTTQTGSPNSDTSKVRRRGLRPLRPPRKTADPFPLAGTELTRSWSALESFGISFSIISIVSLPPSDRP